jgi:hypothetical protein
MVMGVHSATTKLYISPSVAAVARHPTFLPLVTVLLLYSASYLTDIWQHDGFASPSSSVTRGKSIGGNNQAIIGNTANGAAISFLSSIT